jgi:hypothetical protein
VRIPGHRDQNEMRLCENSHATSISMSDHTTLELDGKLLLLSRCAATIAINASRRNCLAFSRVDDVERSCDNAIVGAVWTVDTEVEVLNVPGLVRAGDGGCYRFCSLRRCRDRRVLLWASWPSFWSRLDNLSILPLSACLTICLEQ